MACFVTSATAGYRSYVPPLTLFILNQPLSRLPLSKEIYCLGLIPYLQYIQSALQHVRSPHPKNNLPPGTLPPPTLQCHFRRERAAGADDGRGGSDACQRAPTSQTVVRTGTEGWVVNDSLERRWLFRSSCALAQGCRRRMHVGG
jgi:hypothetical protein